MTRRRVALKRARRIARRFPRMNLSRGRQLWLNLKNVVVDHASGDDISVETTFVFHGDTGTWRVLDVTPAGERGE